MPCSRTCVVSHWVCSPWPHMKQEPQAIWKGTTTRSPTLRSCTSRPAPSTTPNGSSARTAPPAVTDAQVLHVAAALLDHAHRLMAQDVALAHEGAEYLVQVQVGAADTAGGDADDRVAGPFDARVGHGVHRH